ncbi:MAG: DUF5671 domain-containing protein [Candidatus Saccharimonadales bacterium]
MNKTLSEYVNKARKKGLRDSDIKERLLDAGWGIGEVYAAIDGSDELAPPLPDSGSGRKNPSARRESSRGDKPINVITSGFSGSGFEYIIYFLALGVVALSVGAVLHSIINVLIDTEKFSFYQETIPIASAALVVAAPVFIGFMLRLKKKEARSPEILLDPSRRRAVQLLLLVTFIVGVIKLVAYVYNIITIGDATAFDSQTSLLAETLHALITIGIAGGIFWKYFKEQSKLD